MMGKPLQSQPRYNSFVRDHGKRSNYESKAKGVSISASILSILVYILVFYIFDLSPSLVLNSSKFWFFLCNTLIIIIAADYGSFSSSCYSVHDPYDEYVAQSRQPMSTIYHQPYYTDTCHVPSSLHLKDTHHGEERREDEDGVVEVKNVIFSASIEPKEEDDDEEEEVTKELVLDETTWKVPTQDSIWELISKEADEKVRKENASHRNIINHADEGRKQVKKFRRTASEKLPEATHVEKHQKKNVIHRWESERQEPLVAENENEKQEGESGSDQFATMTDEELNRRVEEFIQKFNRHIRLERNINF